MKPCGSHVVWGSSTPSSGHLRDRMGLGGPWWTESCGSSTKQFLPSCVATVASFTFIHFPHLAKHNSCALLSLRSDWRRPNKFFKQKSRWVWGTKCSGQQRLLFGRGTKGWLLWLSDKLGTTNLSLMWQPSGLAVVFVGPPSIAQKLLCSLNEVFLTPA